MGLREKGYLTIEELKSSHCNISKERLDKGPVAIIECNEHIPCNPCEAVCNFKAISIGKPITNPPVLDEKLCTGCGLCVSKCPGLAIFIIDNTYSDLECLVSFPYEYFPLPKRGLVVDAVNRRGVAVCKGKVIKILNPKKYDKTPVVCISIPKQYLNEVRGIRRIKIDDLNETNKGEQHE